MKISITFFIVFLSLQSTAQNDRLNDYNNLVWLQSFNTIAGNKKWSIHAEYQWRRDNGLKNWQQSLLRVGANYKISDNVIVHTG